MTSVSAGHIWSRTVTPVLFQLMRFGYLVVDFLLVHISFFLFLRYFLFFCCYFVASVVVVVAFDDDDDDDTDVDDYDDDEEEEEGNDDDLTLQKIIPWLPRQRSVDAGSHDDVSWVSNHFN